MKTARVLQELFARLPNMSSGPMILMAREGTVRDIPEWQALHRSLGIPYSKAEWATLPQMWDDLLSSGRLKLFLVENRINPPGARLVSCCAAVFATDRFCIEACSFSPPFLGTQLVRRYRSGEAVMLSRPEIARANTKGGLNLVLCFEGPERGALLGEHYLALQQKRGEAFHLAIAGYRLKQFLANPIGEQAYEETRDAGAILRTDYAKVVFAGNGACPTHLRPRLVGLTKEEAEAHPGSYLSSLFVHNPPRFHFSRAEQKLLRSALSGETSEELAESLSVSRWTVKKRWQAIYERVADVDRDLLPCSLADGTYVHGRGAERRRRLLGYLRQHPEELRPFQIDE